jgi:hypothetical protein
MARHREYVQGFCFNVMRQIAQMSSIAFCPLLFDVVEKSFPLIWVMLAFYEICEIHSPTSVLIYKRIIFFMYILDLLLFLPSLKRTLQWF